MRVSNYRNNSRKSFLLIFAYGSLAFLQVFIIEEVTVWWLGTKKWRLITFHFEEVLKHKLQSKSVIQFNTTVLIENRNLAMHVFVDVLTYMNVTNITRQNKTSDGNGADCFPTPPNNKTHHEHSSYIHNV